MERSRATVPAPMHCSRLCPCPADRGEVHGAMGLTGTGVRREAARLASLRSYQLDDSPDPTLDHLVTLAARTLDTPMAALSLVAEDRQWFKAAHGFTTTQTSRQGAFCDDVVAGDQPIIIPDTLADPRYRDNPYVTGDPHLRAYAGAPIIGRDGLPLGTLCGLDQRPRSFQPAQLQELERLTQLVGQVLDLRRVDTEAGLAACDVLRDGRRLRAAVEQAELVVHYQPVIDLRTGHIAGLEALVRWQHPERGLLPPSEFLPLAERSGLIAAVDQHVLEHASRQVAQWRQTIPAARQLHLAVNLSGRQLADPLAARSIAARLRDSGLPAHALVVELTETALVDQASAQAVLGELHGMGVRLALDDFGTGYSSLAYLQQFAVDQVKLDRCFVSTLDAPDAAATGTDPLGRVASSSRGVTITAAAVALAIELGCDVVAEGVERRAQLTALRALGTRYAQGYLFSAPRPPEEIASLLRGAPARPPAAIVAS